MITKEHYDEWFITLDTDVKKKMCETWGNPPGEEIDDVAAAMVYDNKIVVTGVQYSNAVICVQPKRGCAGSRCDGQVCKILHDPELPPTHQYLATYRWIENDFKADVIVHVGTHGGLTTAAKEISKSEVSTYYGDTRDMDRVEIRTLADEIRRIARTKLLNPKWIEGMKRHGYKGAGDMSKRIGRIYG